MTDRASILVKSGLGYPAPAGILGSLLSQTGHTSSSDLTITVSLHLLHLTGWTPISFDFGGVQASHLPFSTKIAMNCRSPGDMAKNLRPILNTSLFS